MQRTGLVMQSPWHTGSGFLSRHGQSTRRFQMDSIVMQTGYKTLRGVGPFEATIRLGGGETIHMSEAMV